MLHAHTRHQKHAKDFGDCLQRDENQKQIQKSLEFNNSPAWIPLFNIRVRRLVLRAELGPQELAEVESDKREIAF